MKLEEIFLIARFFKIKSYKYPEVEEAYLRAANFLQDLVCNFGRNDAKIHSVLVEKMNFHPFELPQYMT